MDIEQRIRDSEWWREAANMPDRHHDPSSGIVLTDHLEAVHENLGFLVAGGNIHPYFEDLNAALTGLNLKPGAIRDLLSPVALLHDIGKIREEKKALMPHPVTGKHVEKRHPAMSHLAALELLPEETPFRETILALVEDHDTPWSWFRQFQRTGQTPKRKSWARLDRKIWPKGDGTGLVFLCLFKMADIEGHATIEDVIWFVSQANLFLKEMCKQLPVPAQDALMHLTDPG